MNTLAETSSVGAKGLSILPFGNGAERILGNRNVGVQMVGLELNIHTSGDLFRAAQEGIVFALKYGTEIMQGMGVSPKTIRAGDANLFKSELFATTFTQTIGAPLELLETDGAEGAARGAGIGAKIFTPRTAFNGLQRKGLIEPDVSNQQQYLDAYARWKERLVKLLRETE
jgi:xylulokinase